MLYKPPLFFKKERSVNADDGIEKVRWLGTDRRAFTDEDGDYYVELTTYERIKPFLQGGTIIGLFWYFCYHIVTRFEVGRMAVYNFDHIYPFGIPGVIATITLFGFGEFYQGLLGREYFIPSNGSE